MVRIGIVGIGFMGMIHFLAARGVRGAKVTAICSRDAKKLSGDWRGIKGNFGPAGEVMELSGVQKYDSLDNLLADPEIDIVDVCSPTELHHGVALKALASGKHVLVEKPIALELRHADEMVTAAAKANRLLMVAHVLPFFPEFAFAERVIRENRYGRMLAAHFKRVISKPDWPAKIADAAKSGGPAIDLHIHDTHFIGLLCGAPRRVHSNGVEDHDAVQYITTQYDYGNGGPAVSCCSGAIAQTGRPFVHGFEIYLETATLLYDSGTLPLTVLTADGGSEKPQLGVGDNPVSAFTTELQVAVDAVASGTEPALLSGKLARDALAMCHKECESVRLGHAVDM